MIVIRVELWSARTGEISELARMQIAPRPQSDVRAGFPMSKPLIVSFPEGTDVSSTRQGRGLEQLCHHDYGEGYCTAVRDARSVLCAVHRVVERLEEAARQPRRRRRKRA